MTSTAKPAKKPATPPAVGLQLPATDWWALLKSTRIHIVRDYLAAGDKTRCTRPLGPGWRSLKPSETVELRRVCRDCLRDLLDDPQASLIALPNKASQTPHPGEPPSEEEAAA